jgi:hypothetical protein
MALNDLIASLVGVADRLTGPLQATVEHHVYRRMDGKGKVEYYPAPDLVPAVVARGQTRTGYNERGEVVPVRAVLTFPRPMSVDLRDKFVLPDRTTGPTVNLDAGVVNPSDGARYVTEVGIGA